MVESVAHSVIKEEKKKDEESLVIDVNKEEEAVEEEEEIDESEDVKMVETTTKEHSQELLEKVYEYLHLSIRPRLFKLIRRAAAAAL